MSSHVSLILHGLDLPSAHDLRLIGADLPLQVDMAEEQQLVVYQPTLSYIALPVSTRLVRFEHTRTVPDATPNTRSLRFHDDRVEYVVVLSVSCRSPG